jgi:SAM-dependent methyltransferase
MTTNTANTAPPLPAAHPQPHVAVPGPFVIPPLYADRPGKARYIATKYASALTGGVLDVGCDQRQLAALLAPGTRYVGLDIGPAADVRHDLESGPLPFADQSFDAVIAADVLEHLERAHATLDELCRVARTWVIIALPNPALNFLHALAAGTIDRFKYYGLPVDAPQDRHRWFFTSADAEAFTTTRAARNGFAIAQLDFEPYPAPPPYFSRSGRLLTQSPALLRGTMWAALRRDPHDTRPTRPPSPPSTT